jgi:putative nucleotidyltransferase with HDIG domain
MTKIGHLVKRFFMSLDRRGLSKIEIDSVCAVLAPREFELWSQMSLFDKKHSITVRRRFLELIPNAEIFAVRASLLHDIGKTKSNLGVLSRVLATIVGSKGKRFAQYHDHEAIGAEMLRQIGSEENTCRLVAGSFSDYDASLSKYVLALRSADQI